MKHTYTISSKVKVGDDVYLVEPYDEDGYEVRHCTVESINIVDVNGRYVWALRDKHNGSYDSSIINVHDESLFMTREEFIKC